MLDGKCIVNFLLVTIELFSLALMAEALLSEICRNRRFLKGWVTLKSLCSKGGWVTLSANFRGNRCCPPTTVGVKKLESLGYHMALFV